MEKKSYSQRKRDKMDYRREYFSHNPGLFGCIWTCAYCHRPLVGKQNVNVDHIMPLNNVLGRNAGYNLVAACERCNKRKSDKVDGRVVQGYISKLFEVVIFSIQKVIVVFFVGLWYALWKVLSTLGHLLTAPFHGTSMTVKLLGACAYCAIIYYVVNSF